MCLWWVYVKKFFKLYFGENIIFEKGWENNNFYGYIILGNVVN